MVGGLVANERITVSRPGWLVAAVAGLLGCVLTLFLPWLDDGRLAVGVRMVMVVGGVAVLIVVAGFPRGPTRGLLPLVGALGCCLVAYPSLLALSAAGWGGPAIWWAAGGWHILPLTLVQLAPVAASTRIVRRTRRRWEAAILGFAVVSTTATVLAVASAPGSDVWLSISTATFAGSFLLAPIATWTAVAGTSGETRRRAVLAAVASLFPVVITVGCAALGTLAAGVGASEDRSVTALLLGFALGTLGCGLAVVATAAPAGSSVLRTRVVVVALDALAAALVVITGLAVALILPADAVASGWALLAGGVVAAALILPWLRLHAWIVRVVDPAAELRHELSLIGDAADGRQRQAVLVILRRLVEDPDLRLFFRVDDDSWVGMDGEIHQSPVEASTVTLASRASRPAVLVSPGTPESAARLASLGDVTAALRSALLEAAVDYESARAGQAAENARRQLERDLHDGLQGRLLGLALNLQLSGRDVEDPTARLLLAETVANLRSTVDDVRALGGGRQPELLARSGLAPALTSLFRHARPVVELDVPPIRFAAEVETTAYFVIGEAVTNALKHAGASSVGVRLTKQDDALTVTISDDGCGGADPRLGSGLRGLAERVAATGGALVVRDGVRDGVSSGTVVEAVLPCGS